VKYTDPDGLSGEAAQVVQQAQQFGPYAGLALVGLMAVALVSSPEVRQDVGQAICDTGVAIKNKGPLKRAIQSSIRESVQYDILPINIDWTPAVDKKEAFLDEYMRIQDNGGPASQYSDAPSYNYNLIQSPGEKIYKTEHNGQTYPRSIPQNGAE